MSAVKYDIPGSHWSYADPAQQYELKELRSCHGCIHAKVAFMTTRYCDKAHKYGKKCKDYSLPNGDANK